MRGREKAPSSVDESLVVPLPAPSKLGLLTLKLGLFILQLISKRCTVSLVRLVVFYVRGCSRLGEGKLSLFASGKYQNYISVLFFYGAGAWFL